MAATREVKVIINGEEFVSKAARKAEDGMGGFFGKVKGWMSGMADFKAGWDMIAGALSRVADFTSDLFRASDELAASNRKLEGTAKLSGVALGTLRDVAKSAGDGFKLSTPLANDFSAEIVKLTSKAGDVGKSKDALAAFLEIGAARGMSASETLKAVQQSILGIDEGTDKLFGKNPSVLYAEYAEKIGTTAGKLTDQQKAQALLDATLTGGEATRGSYAEFLTSAAGKQDLMNQRIESAKAAFGTALQPLRLLVMEGIVAFVEWISRPEIAAFAEVVVAIGKNIIDTLLPPVKALGTVAVPVLNVVIGVLTEMTFALRAWSVYLQDSFGKSVQAIAGFGEGVASLLRKVGIDINTEGIAKMRAFGERMESEAGARWTALSGDHAKFWDKMLGQGDAGIAAVAQQEAKHTDTVKKGAQARVKETEEEKKKRIAAEKKFAKEVQQDVEETQKKVDAAFKKSADEAVSASIKLRDAWGRGLTATLANASEGIERIEQALLKVNQTNAPDEIRRLTETSQGYLATLRLMQQAHEAIAAADHGLPPADAVARLDAIIMKMEQQASIEFTNTGNAADFAKRMEVINALKTKQRDLAKDAADQGERDGKAAENTAKTYQKMVEAGAGIARAGIDAAQAFGVLDTKAASVLNSAIAIGEAVGNIINATSKEGIAGGIAAVVASIANVAVQLIGGDAARKKLIEENSRQLERLRGELGNLKLNVTGDDFVKAQRALTGVIGQLRGGRGAQNTVDVLNALRGQGLSMGDLEKIAQEFGIRIRSDSGALSVDGLRQLLEAFGSVELGRVGQSFGEQLDFFRESQRLDGASGMTQIRDLLTFLRDVGGVGALRGLDFSDPAQLRNALAALRTSMNNGQGLDAASLGKLTGGQFMDLLVDLIGMIDDLKEDGGAPAGGAGTSASGSGGETSGTVDVPGIGPVPAAAATIIPEAIAAQTTAIRELHAESMAAFTRIADATEATAFNTRETADNTREIADLIAAGALGGDSVDVQLEQARRRAERASGAAPVVG
jgi:hypothetical protein